VEPDCWAREVGGMRASAQRARKAAGLDDAELRHPANLLALTSGCVGSRPGTAARRSVRALSARRRTLGLGIRIRLCAHPLAMTSIHLAQTRAHFRSEQLR
jgi:hypothetical protein